MQYEEALRYIHSLEKFGVKPGLERIRALCRAFGDVQNTLRFVHVAGTNGKGSTSTMIANICTAAGYKTGLFVSPYVLDFRERIRVDGEMIPPDALARIVTRVKTQAEKMRKAGECPTEFEVITAAALVYYAQRQCDVVVLETGLGGRLDATNVVPCPLVSVITSVSLDHMAVLGDTVEQIAREKCGILKEGGVTVTYPLQHPDALRVIRQTANDRHNRLIVPNADGIRITAESIDGSDAVIGSIAVHVPLLGRHMVYNASMAVAAAQSLREQGLAIEDGHIRDGIAQTAMPARMQILRRRPLVMLDGGHNEDCARAFRAAAERFLAGRRIIGICGLMADKAYDDYLSIVAPLFCRLLTVRPDNPRALSAEALCDAGRAYCPNASPCGSFREAAALALREAGEDDVIAVCGSFYMMADIAPYFL